MKDFKTLKLLDRIAPLFEKAGVDYKVMRSILQLKLTMDGRRVPTIMSQSRKRKSKSGKPDAATDESTGNQFLKSLWIYSLLGLITVPLVVMGTNFLFQMSLVYGIMMFMLGTSMIADFSTVLLDIRDKTILFTRPVGRRTIAMARTVHVLIYLGFLSGVIALPPLAAGLIRHGVGFFLLFLLGVILLNIGVVLMTAFVYFLVLRFLDGEKLKDVINYVQIALSVGITVGYQFVGRSFNLIERTVVLEPHWWQLSLPPLWLAAPMEVLLHGSRDPRLMLFSVLAVVLPIAAIFTYVRMLPAFERNLQKLANNGGEKGRRRRSALGLLAALVCPSKEERTFFRFASQMMRAERDFKLKVYPSLGLSIVFPFIFIFNQLRSGGLDSIASTRWVLSFYFSALLIPTVIMMIRYSGSFKGAWIYQAAPLVDEAPVYKGVLKALMIRLYMPVYIIQGAVYLLLYGPQILPDMTAVLLVAWGYAVLCFLFFRKTLPFSESFAAAQYESWKTMLLVLLIVLFAGLHLGLTFLDGRAVYLYDAALIGANLLLWSLGFKRFRPQV